MGGAAFRFRVYDCSPVARGKAGADTALITLLDAPRAPPALVTPPSHTPPPQSQVPLKLSTFTQRGTPAPQVSVSPEGTPQPHQSSRALRANDITGVKLRSLLALWPPAISSPGSTPHPHSYPWELYSMLGNDKSGAGLTVTLATPTTLRHVGAFQRSWVLLRLEGGCCRLVYLLSPHLLDSSKAAAAQSLGMEDDVVYVHPMVACSLGVEASTAAVYCEAVPHLSSSCPPSARSVQLLPVQAPTLASIPQSLVDAAVKNFFAPGQYVAEGDIVTVVVSPAQGDTDAQLQSVAMQVDETATGQPDPLLFRIGHAEGVNDETLRLTGGLFHIGDSTALTLGPPVCAAPPPFAAHFATPALLGPLAITPFCLELSAHRDLLAVVQAAQGAGVVSSILVRGQDADMIQHVIRNVASERCLHLLAVNCHALELAVVSDVLCMAVRRGPALVHFRHWDALVGKAQASEGPDAASSQRGADNQAALALSEALEAVVAVAPNHQPGQLVVVLSCEDAPLTMRNTVDADVELGPLSAADRTSLLARIVKHLRCTVSLRLDVTALADRTAGLALGDVAAVVQGAVRRAVARQSGHLLPADPTSAGDIDSVNTQLIHAGVVATLDDIDKELQSLGSSRGLGADAGRIARVDWEDVGGLAQAKQEILDVIQLPLQQPQLFAQGLHRRSGVLLYGPPGCGKTLLAKAVASQCALRFLSVKGPELVNMYVGESERNVREVFAKARNAAPCVVFFDELDSVAPRRGAAGDSGGVMDRVVSQLLAELDGAAVGDGRQAVFVLGATNRPDLLDTALLRPGRLDRLVYVGCPKSRQQQALVLQAQLRKFPLAPDVALEALLTDCPFTLTGADFKALATDALMAAVQRALAAHREAPTASTPPAVTVGMADLEAARDALVPSVSPHELAQYEALQRQYELHSASSH
eukprot:GGOE01014935.1.p1 GENE.GGOE01014935.1~~GGOE01014935.1.p1  ORF type:complete len:989 (+),score=256.45 GGOE01014935.1:186-2969(+)